MNVFTSNLLRDALKSSRVADHDVKRLFQQLDIQSNQSLGKMELAELIRLIEDKTTGQRNTEDIRPYLIDRLLERMDSDRNGVVSMQEFEQYVTRYGLVVDLNIAA